MIRFEDGTVRYLTTFEAKRLQTFPDDFVIKGAWGEAMRQIGNAVPVLLAEKIGIELAKIISDSNQSFERSAVSLPPSDREVRGENVCTTRCKQLLSFCEASRAFISV